MESFGARLKRERRQRKIELDDISASTKISSRFLRALEEEQFDQLPGGIFSKGSVRAYARHLGIDEEQAVADYLGATAPSSPSELPPSDLPVEMAEQLEHREPVRAVHVPWTLFAALVLITAFG